MSRWFFVSALLGLALPGAAQTWVPMAVTFTTPNATTLLITFTGGPAEVELAMVCPNPQYGGEGGCVNLPGRASSNPASNTRFYSLAVPDSTALCGLVLDFYAAQIVPPVYAVATNTVECGS
jgi:hypothetical protein